MPTKRQVLDHLKRDELIDAVEYYDLRVADRRVRVADRVRRGGHHVPDDVVRRRYHGGLRNFFRLYRPLAATWRFYDNAGQTPPRLVARGGMMAATRVVDELTWRRVTQGIEDEHQS